MGVGSDSSNKKNYWLIMKANKNNVGVGVALGVAFGAAMGAAMGGLGIWIALGVALGAAIGAAWPSTEANSAKE